jgi:hypothetical protein
MPALRIMLSLVEKIIIVIEISKVVLCSRSAAERLAVPDLLQIVQPAGDASVAVAELKAYRLMDALP